MEVTGFGKVTKEGKMVLNFPSAFAGMVKDHLANKRVEFIVRTRDKHFTDPQRSYYFGVIIREMQKAFRTRGDIKTQQEIDEYMRSLYLYQEYLDPETDEWIKVNHRLSNADSVVTSTQMTEFLQQCIIYAATRLDWAIPMPNEEWYAQKMTERQQYYEGVAGALENTSK